MRRGARIAMVAAVVVLLSVAVMACDTAIVQHCDPDYHEKGWKRGWDTFVAEQLMSFDTQTPLPRYESIDKMHEALFNLKWAPVVEVQHATNVQRTQTGDCVDFSTYTVAALVRSGLVLKDDIRVVRAEWSGGYHVLTAYLNDGVWWLTSNWDRARPHRVARFEDFVDEVRARHPNLCWAASSSVELVDERGTVFLGQPVAVSL